MSLPKRFSATMIQTWLRCPACWSERYVDKEKGGLSGNLLLGRVFSDALKALHSEQDWQKVFVQKYEEMELLCLSHCGTKLSAPMDVGLRLLSTYANEGVYEGVPEFPFTTPIKHLPVPITGYFDLLEHADGEPRGIVEYKSTAARWSQERVDSEIQGTLYWCAFWSLYRQLPNMVYVVFDLPREKVLRFETTRSREECIELLELMKRIYCEMEEAHGEDGQFSGKCPKHKEPSIAKQDKLVLPTWDWGA